MQIKSKLQTSLMLSLSILPLGLIHAQERAQNPIITHMYKADPTARVWEDGW